MIYLFLAIICSSTIAFLFKFAENRKMNPYLVTTANYFVASIISLFMIINNNLLKGLVKEQSFLKEWKILLAEDQYLLSPYNSVIWGMIVGGVQVCFSFILFYTIKKA